MTDQQCSAIRAACLDGPCPSCGCTPEDCLGEGCDQPGCPCSRGLPRLETARPAVPKLSDEWQSGGSPS